MIAILLALLLSGTFALQSGAPKTQGHFSAKQIGTSVLDQRFDFWYSADAKTLTRYRIDMTKYVHLIVISDDFTSFAHVHPTLGPDGHFHIDQHFPRPGLYHVYSDAEPDAFGQQVFRYDLAVGSAVPGPRTLARPQTAFDVDGYHVVIGSTRLAAGVETQIPIHITKNGRPAADLHPYLGALAHAVFIDAGDLSYTHVHPAELGAASMGDGDMAGMPGMDMPVLPASAHSSPAMRLDVRVAHPGRYKLWLQFRGGTGLHVATFVLSA